MSTGPGGRKNQKRTYVERGGKGKNIRDRVNATTNKFYCYKN